MKFKDEEEIILNNAVELEQYLSSGTIKGIITFSMVKEVLASGGYILVDNNLLIFTREEMLDEKVIRCRSAKNFEEKYLRKGFDEPTTMAICSWRNPRAFLFLEACCWL